MFSSSRVANVPLDTLVAEPRLHVAGDVMMFRVIHAVALLGGTGQIEAPRERLAPSVGTLLLPVSATAWMRSLRSL